MDLIDGETVETVSDFILRGPKITADGDCSHEIKRRLLLGRKVMTKLDSIFSSILRHSAFFTVQLSHQYMTTGKTIVLTRRKQKYYFANKGPCSQGYGFSSGHVWMWKLDCEESWALEDWCFWTVVLEKSLESPLDCGGSNQSILKEISPGCSLEGLMLKLKLQYFGHLMWRVDSLEKTLMLGGIGGRRRRVDRGWDGWMASPTRWMWVWVNSGSWWCTGRPGVLRFMGLQRVRHDWVTELNWTDNSGGMSGSDAAYVCNFIRQYQFAF